MPSLVRKLLVCAAAEGIILQPLSSRKESTESRAAAPFRIRYGDATISTIPREEAPSSSKPGTGFEAFGIVGLITILNYSYLISITRRKQVATIKGCPIFVVTEVALTPCTSYKDASESIVQTIQSLKERPPDRSPGDTDSEEEHEPPPPPSGSDEIGEDSSGGENHKQDAGKKSSVAQDVISRRGSYGRFAQRWFSKKGWMQDQKRTLGLTDRAVEQAIEEVESKQPNQPASKTGGEAEGEGDDDDDEITGNRAILSLLPKLLRTTQIFFGTSQSFFFAYDYDLTRSLARNQAKVASSNLPLHKMVDPLYFWNAQLMKPFTEVGIDSLSLPLMQGFVGQRSFVVDSNPPQTDDVAKDSVEMHTLKGENESLPATTPPNERSSKDFRATEKMFDITVISRRSVKRAGLRFMRRGIDEEGNVANNVETEQILSPADGNEAGPIYSFLQIRGSIPLYFTQTPYSLKPAPVIHHSLESNYQALKKHVDRLRSRYGQLQIVNLVEKRGSEGSIGTQYERSVQRYNEENATESVPFEWFDFHDACRGMKFENVSLLLDTLSKKIQGMGQTVEKGDQVIVEQKGVLRTNCMDCLDRTNVCQSSFARYMLEAQLKEQGFDLSAQKNQDNSWFNTLWADNGDFISKQYASTGAMKGDYTRTRKRDYRGALTDVGLSLTRLFNGMFNDFFLQATIDFLLGNVTYSVFEEFEANMMTKDPAVSMQKMREQAIDLCQRRVVEDESEEFISGWTLLSPHVSGSLSAQPFEEVVLLLTDAALYLCRFDWTLDKVSSFERVELSHIENIKFGTYIISTMSAAQRDEARNVGLLITYAPGRKDVMRVNTRSMSSSGTITRKAVGGPATVFAGLLGRKPADSPESGKNNSSTSSAAPVEKKKLALKALTAQSSTVVAGETPSKITELQQVVSVCAEVERLALASRPHLKAGRGGGGGGSGEVVETLIEKGDIVSLAEAKKATGPLEYLGHSIKKLIWA